MYREDQARMPPAQRVLLPLRYAAISLASLFVAKSAQAQTFAAPQDSSTMVTSHDTMEKKVAGKVVTKKGEKPLANARVYISNAESTIVAVSTMDDGTFECVLPSTTDTSFIISISSSGFIMETYYNYVPCNQFLIVKMEKQHKKLFHRHHRKTYSKF